MEIKKFIDFNEWISASIDLIENIFATTDKTKNIALSGGATPNPVYEALSQNKKINFNEINFYEVDERFVPQDHPDSNYKMIYESLISKIDESNFIFFDTSRSIEESLEKYDSDLEKFKDEEFDLTILGIGGDGHFASLFPNTQALHETRNVAHTVTDEHKVRDRLTLTLNPIIKSKKILILLKGKEKEQILDELMNTSKSFKSFEELPAKALLKHNDLTIYYLNQ